MHGGIVPEIAAREDGRSDGIVVVVDAGRYNAKYRQHAVVGKNMKIRASSRLL